MNQVIRELAEQCFSIRYDHDSEMEEFGNDSVTIISEFAELIVRECMIMSDLPHSADGKYDDFLPSQMIAKHFGVE